MPSPNAHPPLRRLGARRFRVVLRRPLLGHRRQRAALAGDLLGLDAIDRHLVEPRIEAFWPVPARAGVFGEEAVEEARLLRGIALDAHGAEADDALIARRGIAFELAIGIDRPRLGGLEADARARLDVQPELPQGAGVEIDPPVLEDEEVGNDIRLARRAHRGEMAERRAARAAPPHRSQLISLSLRRTTPWLMAHPFPSQARQHSRGRVKAGILVPPGEGPD